MKTTSKIKSLLAATCLIFSLISNNAKAQVPNIGNSLSCPILVDIFIYTPGSCTTLCTSITNFPLTTFQVVPIPVGACTTWCNIEVYVTKIGSTAGLSGPADLTNGPISLFSNACSGTTVEYIPGINAFKVYP